jgi:uncharacterized glyoxalase superfamily protein PhnB
MSFDAIGIVSENPARSVEFFKILGVDIKQYESSGHYEGETPSGVRIMLDTVEVIRSMNPNWQKATGNGLVMCFKQSSPQKVDEVYKKVISAGFTSIKSPWDAFWGQRYACVSDPDGNQVDLFAAL